MKTDSIWHSKDEKIPEYEDIIIIRDGNEIIAYASLSNDDIDESVISWAKVKDVVNSQKELSTKVERLEKLNADFANAILKHIKSPIDMPTFISKEQYEKSLEQTMEQLTKGNNNAE